MAGPGLVDVAQLASRRVCLRCAKDVTGHLVKARRGFTCADCGERWGMGGERKWYYLDATSGEWRASHYGITHHYQRHASNEVNPEGRRARRRGIGRCR